MNSDFIITCLSTLALPVSAVLLLYGLSIIYSNYKEKRRKARKQRALREKRIVLERVL